MSNTTKDMDNVKKSQSEKESEKKEQRPANHARGGLGFTRRVQRNHENNNGGNIIDNINADFTSLKDHSFDSLKYSDAYISYMYRNKESDNMPQKVKEAYKKINNILSLEAIIQTIQDYDFSFYYKLLCDKEFDLTAEEKTLLWVITGASLDCLGNKSLIEYYKTTKVYVDISTDPEAEKARPANESDLLGFYTIRSNNHSGLQVWLLMDKITEEAERLGCNRMYVTAAVYIHEMMHRFYDVRPDLGWKQSVKEIEEPMAEFGKLSFCEDFCKDQRHDMYIKLLPIALKLTENLRDDDKHFIYALGADMYYNQKVGINLICKYRYVSLLMHKIQDDKKVNGFKYPINEYLDKYKKENMKDLVWPLEKLITQYAKWFPIKIVIQ